MSQIRNAGRFQVLFGSIATMAIGPILEEILWRKYVLEILRQSFSVVIAVLITVSLGT